MVDNLRRISRRDFLWKAPLAAAIWINIARGDESCSHEPLLIAYYKEGPNNTILELGLAEKTVSGKGHGTLQLKWSPNSKENSLIIERDDVMYPDWGKSYNSTVLLSSKNDHIPESINPQGSLLHENSTKTDAFLKLVDGWKELIEKFPQNETQEQKQELFQTFFNMYGPDIKSKLLESE